MIIYINCNECAACTHKSYQLFKNYLKILPWVGEGAEYLIITIERLGPLCPPCEPISSGAETYYFEYHQGQKRH